MNRTQFRKLFKTTVPVVLPVIHVIDNEQVEANTRIAIGEGCPGIFLINHDFSYPKFLPIIRYIREKFPHLWLGVNFLGVTGKDAFPVLSDLQCDGVNLNAYWADDARINERFTQDEQCEADEISRVRAGSGWEGLYFGGTAFKKQREVLTENYHLAAELACHHMDVVTTSGVATGQAAEISKIETFRKACGDTAIALASGVTPENAIFFESLVDAFLVATGINISEDFYNIDTRRLERLVNTLT